MVDARVGRNPNISSGVDHSIVTVNSVTATTLVTERPLRITFSACLAPGLTNVDVYIRYYPAATDNIKQGRDTLIRDTMGNTNLFKPLHEMLTDNIYDGEISAISLSGTVDILVTES